MANKSIFLLLTLSCYLFSYPCYSETNTLQQGQQLKDWDYLISSNKVFSLKFFSLGTMESPYLGIFYNKKGSSNIYGRYGEFNSDDRAVWVANRNNPIPDISGKLMIDVHGKLSILSSGGTIVDLFSPTPVTRNASATLLDSGNFVLQELYPNGSVKQDLWQSFDYPTDTLLPGMKLGINLETGHGWSLTSWASDQQPASGSFTLREDPNGTDQLVILRRGNIHWTSGPWQNGQFEYTDLQSSGPDVHLYYISNETERSFTYLTRTYDSLPALRMYPEAQLRGSTLRLQVDCTFIHGPGCVEYVYEKLECRNYYDFELLKRIHIGHDSRYNPYPYEYEYDESYHLRYDSTYNPYRYVDEYEYDESYNLTLYDCTRICWNNCSCVAYTTASEDLTGCKTYHQMIYDPAGARNHQGKYYPVGHYKGTKKKIKKWAWLIIGIGSLAPLVLLSCYFVEKKLHVRGKAMKIQKLLLHQLRSFYSQQTYKKRNNELQFFTFQRIASATNNFSSTNKLGEGGFGAVYKGKLIDGQEVAVKRLSRSSQQGITEFMNETQLIAKLQHINLVRLLGCCIEKQEKILVYEYMPNNSLDFFLFDPRKKGLLEWRNRFVIIEGIAQGLLYLHKFSRLKVIHRDLKASNILLDDCLNPKISDFGMAKLFGINESEANTSRVVGTRGYMPPEYMIEGTVSTKTDVFSFGVLLLEIVSSKMNNGSYDEEHPLNLIGLTWELWKAGRGLELMDPILKVTCSQRQVTTCIHVGLLCVQAHATDRPSMSEVISMLTNENLQLPMPKRPAFFIERHEAGATRDDNLRNGSINRQSISVVVAR